MKTANEILNLVESTGGFAVDGIERKDKKKYRYSSGFGYWTNFYLPAPNPPETSPNEPKNGVQPSALPEAFKSIKKAVYKSFKYEIFEETRDGEKYYDYKIEGKASKMGGESPDSIKEAEEFCKGEIDNLINKGYNGSGN